MNKDVSLWDLSVLDCQKTKVARHVRPPVHRIDVLSHCFSQVDINLVGSLPTIHSFTHVFTIVDRSTRWPAAYPVQDTSADTCIAAIAECISGFGIPDTLTSDRSTPFKSSSWSTFSQALRPCSDSVGLPCYKFYL